MKFDTALGLAIVVVAFAAAACGGAQKEATPAATAGADAAAPPAAATADAAPPPPERAFAKTPAEATSLIDEAVSTRTDALTRCVEAARARRKDPHAKISVEIGIDQEGTLLGVTSVKGQPDDKAFNQCVQTALVGAPFPRSHAGVITLKKTFQDTAVYK